MDAATTNDAPIRFETTPERYVHWQLDFPAEHSGRVARLTMNVQDEKGLRPGYVLKLNSYDLGVDLELADVIQRLRFEHPEVSALVITSAKDRVFCSGANIYMLASSTHPFKVNFCKYTNETRLYLESLSTDSGITTVCALNGTASGGGYELALACDEIILQDDGNSAVSFPEAPLLAVLPGTGGLTRVVDKRKVRRDLADVFSTLAEGVRGRRAVDWRLVDQSVPRSRFESVLSTRLTHTLPRVPRNELPEGIHLPPLRVTRDDRSVRYSFVSVSFDPERHLAELTVRGPALPAPRTPEALRHGGAETWCIAAFRELDDALLDLRFNHPSLGLIVLRTEGDLSAVTEWDRSLHELFQRDWLAREIVFLQRRVLKRLDLMARSVFAVIEPGSCFGGSLFELALAADRSFMLDDDDGRCAVTLSPSNFGPLPMGNGLTRLQTRFLGDPKVVEALSAEPYENFDARGALAMGLVTFAPDPIDWQDEVRVAIEERTSLSPDAMTGMEANLRFAGPETLETKIFGRLSAWQNWIFQRPNAVGPRGALTLYGQPEQPVFDERRT